MLGLGGRIRRLPRQAGGTGTRSAGRRSCPAVDLLADSGAGPSPLPSRAAGLSRMRLIDMTLIPVFVSIGVMAPAGLLEGWLVSPKTFAMLGPVRSASRTPTS